jgi:hypothetical protein
MDVRSAILTASSFVLASPISAVGDDELFDASNRLIRSPDAKE